MERISLKLDLTKLDKTRIVERSYTNKEGVEVAVTEYSIDVVPLKPENQKEITSGDTWTLKKKYFAADTATKEERESKTNTTILGEGLVFEDKAQSQTAPAAPSQPEAAEPVGDDDIPFQT